MVRYKAVFSDIDGTILDSEHKLLPDTKQKIRELDQNGIPFVLVSARMPMGMSGIRNELGIQTPMICYSGALVVDEEGRPMFSETMEKQTARDLLGSIHERSFKVSAQIYSGDRWITGDRKDPWTLQESRITGITPEEGNFEDRYTADNIHKILCMGEPEEILGLEKMLKENFLDLNIYRSKDTYLEMMPASASKSNAVKLLEQYFGVLRSEIMAFGDGHNDIDMLSYAGLGIAMENASDEVKGAADLVTDDNDHEGLRKVLEQYF